MNLPEGIVAELRRCRELIEVYKELGPTGVFGKAVIEASITEGEDALASGDVVRMLAAYKDLKGRE